MSQYLKGELTGLTLLANHTDSAQVIQCLTSCQERLDLDPLDDMDTGMVSGQGLSHDETF